MVHGDVVNHLHHDNGLPATGTAEQTHLATAGEGNQQVDNLDAGFKNLNLGILLGELGSRLVDGPLLVGSDGAEAVHGTPDHVHDPAKGRSTDRDLDGCAGGLDHLAAHQTVGLIHGHAATDVVAEMLGNLDNKIVLLVADALVGHIKGVHNLRQLTRLKLHVDNRADNLHNFSVLLITHMPTCLLSIVSIS